MIHSFTIGMILSSLVCSLLVPWIAASPIPSRFFSPSMGSRESASNRISFACGLLSPWAAASPTHNQGTSSPHGQQGKMRHPKWKGEETYCGPKEEEFWAGRWMHKESMLGRVKVLRMKNAKVKEGLREGYL